VVSWRYGVRAVQRGKSMHVEWSCARGPIERVPWRAAEAVHGPASKRRRGGVVRRQPIDRQRKAEALKLAAEHGSAEASRRTGASAETIRYWRHKAAKAAGPTDADSDDVERLERLARDLRAAAEEALAKAREAIAAGRGAEAKNLAVTAGVAVSTRNPVLAGLSGGPCRNRTYNLEIKSLLLCQLS
jgi:hypothetical protein